MVAVMVTRGLPGRNSVSQPLSWSVPDDAVVVAIPPNAAHFRMLRLAAAVVAADLLDIASIEDSQIGLEEAASLLLDADPNSRIEATLWCSDGLLHVRVQSNIGAVPSDPLGEGFRRTILEAVTDDLRVAHDEVTGTTAVLFTKTS